MVSFIRRATARHVIVRAASRREIAMFQLARGRVARENVVDT
jgi:hypothetical protein